MNLHRVSNFNFGETQNGVTNPTTASSESEELRPRNGIGESPTNDFRVEIDGVDAGQIKAVESGGNNRNGRTDASAVHAAEYVKVPSRKDASQIAEAKLQGDARAAELHNTLNRMTDVVDGTSNTLKHQIQKSQERSKMPERELQETVVTELEEFANAVVDPATPETGAAQSRRRLKDRRAEGNDGSSSQVTAGWDVKQGAKG